MTSRSTSRTSTPIRGCWRRNDKTVKKLFISQPMRGLTDEEIIAAREKAAIEIANRLDEPVQILDSFFKGAPAENRPLWYLGKSLQMLAEADIAFFAKGWENARGCKMEHLCATEYGVTVIEEE